MPQSKALIYKKIPTEAPVPGEHLAVESRDFDLNQAPPAGGAIVRGLYFSLDPYMRGRMRDPKIPSYAPAFTLHQAIGGYAIAQIVTPSPELTAKHGYGAGDIVFGLFEIAEYSVASAASFALAIGQKIEREKLLGYGGKIPLSNYVSILGMTGLTAYSSLYEIGRPKKGETIFISSAAGAVGQVVGQIAKREGLRVIGSVGDDAKLEFVVKELGFDGAWNYKKGETPEEALKRLAPDGLDIYYDNVGGEQLDAALGHMNVWGRVVFSGMISQYNVAPEQRYRVKNLGQAISKRLKMQGFLVNDPDFGPKYGKEMHERVAEWLAEGSIKSKEHINDGIDTAAEGFVAMLEGKNFGKAVVRVADPE